MRKSLFGRTIEVKGNMEEYLISGMMEIKSNIRKDGSKFNSFFEIIYYGCLKTAVLGWLFRVIVYLFVAKLKFFRTRKFLKFIRICCHGFIRFIAYLSENIFCTITAS